jgi:hypothetical protein
MDPSQPGAQMSPPGPKNWLVESILVTIFCCIPLGIGGIVNAASVNRKYNSGDYAGALNSSKQAGKWTKTGFWIGIAIWGAYAIFLFVNRNRGGFGMPG